MVCCHVQYSSELYSKEIEKEELQAEVDRKTEEVQTKEMVSDILTSRSNYYIFQELNATIKLQAERRQEVQQNLTALQKSIQEGYKQQEGVDRKILEYVTKLKYLDAFMLYRAKNEIKKLDKIYAEKTAQFKELLHACVSYIAASRVRTKLNILTNYW